MTKKDAVEKWMNEFNVVPREVSELLFDNDKLYEITPITKGSYVYVFDDEYEGEAQIVNRKGLDKEGNELLDEDGFELDDHFMIEVYNGIKREYETYIISADCIEQKFDSALPMWNNMWSFGDGLDDDWVDHGGLEALAECGFRVYETEAYGYVFGIDGAGYSFKDQHFTPLYEARGLKWHKEEISVEEQAQRDKKTRRDILERSITIRSLIKYMTKDMMQTEALEHISENNDLRENLESMLYFAFKLGEKDSDELIEILRTWKKDYKEKII